MAAGLGLKLVENGFRVLYQRTANLVQKLQAARRDLALEAAIRKLHKYHLLILDDFSYVTHEQAETSVLFELIGARYENRSVLVIANEAFSAWGRIFGGDAMTMAAVDRLVHRSHIFELNAESYRRRAAYAAQAARAKEPGRRGPGPGGGGLKRSTTRTPSPEWPQRRGGDGPERPVEPPEESSQDTSEPLTSRISGSNAPNPGRRSEQGARIRPGGRSDGLGLPIPLGKCQPSDAAARLATLPAPQRRTTHLPPRRAPPLLPQPLKLVIISTLEASRPLVLTLIVATLSS